VGFDAALRCVVVMDRLEIGLPQQTLGVQACRQFQPGRLGASSSRLQMGLNDRLSDRKRPALKGVDQVLGMQFEFFQADFLELFVFGEIAFLKQFFQSLSVAMMFGVQAVQFFAQRGILYFVHPAPP
jgi:hypothetical protein